MSWIGVEVASDNLAQKQGSKTPVATRAATLCFTWQICHLNFTILRGLSEVLTLNWQWGHWLGLCTMDASYSVSRLRFCHSLGGRKFRNSVCLEKDTLMSSPFAVQPLGGGQRKRWSYQNQATKIHFHLILASLCCLYIPPSDSFI